MRILCLNLQQNLEPACAEIFLKFSPRVQFRPPSFIFIDIDSTSGLFGGEMNLLKKAVELARNFAPKATAAIADSPPLAQVMVQYRPFEISNFGDSFRSILKLPISALKEFEGLEPWNQGKPIEHVINFFKSMGLEWIEEVFHFQEASFRERWGSSGVLLWKRLHGQDFQVISPFVSTEPLYAYEYLDEGISDLHFLLPRLRGQLQFLFSRLEGLCRFAQKIELNLFCEYSGVRHLVFIEPINPNRDLNLFLDLIGKKIEKFDFENPIKEFELQIFDVPEKTLQMDFFEPRETNRDRWERLLSFARQADIEMGFLQIEKSHLPETSYSFKMELPNYEQEKDQVQWNENAIQVKTSHAKSLASSPRPSLLLKEPLRLSKLMMRTFKFLTRLPTERIQNYWWKNEQARDYYFALSNRGQLMWIYRDLRENTYFLQGYFD